jgi:predicted nucleotidyltransferase
MTTPRGKPRTRKLVSALRAYEPESEYLFGSWARAEADDLSDLDLVLIKGAPHHSLIVQEK